jgi:RNA polymerase sigma factor (sigma-70 family)
VGRVWRSAQPEEPGDDALSSDARLVDGLRRGAPAAFAGLHERYATGIYNLALRVVRHGPDAEDITQDVLIRAFERLPHDREVLLRPWLYRLTLNRCYDYLRGSARRPLPVATSADTPAPQDPYEHSELQRLLEAAIGDLTRRQRAALLLKDVHGLSLVEVAACLDLTPGSVEVLLARARRAFRARFEERCSAAGRPLPRSSSGLTALPMLPLPAGLTAPALPLPLVPPAHLPPAALACPPLTVAAGSGIGAGLGLPASVKTAVLITAAAATVGTAEIAVTQVDHRPPRAAGAAALVASAPDVAEPATAASGSPRARATAAPSPAPSASPSPPGGASPVVSPSPAQVAEPTPQGSPLAIATPSPEPSATPTDAPTAHATPPPATPSPVPSPSPTSDPSPSPAATP